MSHDRRVTSLKYIRFYFSFSSFSQISLAEPWLRHVIYTQAPRCEQLQLALKCASRLSEAAVWQASQVCELKA